MVVIPTIHASLREQRLPLDTAAFGVKVAHEPGNWLVSLSGEVDYAASLELNTTLGDIADRCDKDLLLDLSAVTMIDSEGIKTLFRFRSRKNAPKLMYRHSAVPLGISFPGRNLRFMLMC